MRKSVVIIALLILLALGSTVPTVYYYSQSKEVEQESGQTVDKQVSYLLSTHTEQDSDLVLRLSNIDGQWLSRTTSDIKEYIMQMNESEENRRILAEKEAKVREEFLKQQEEAALEQQALLDKLNQQALDAIRSEGGVGATLDDSVVLTPEMAQEIMRRRLAGESLEGIVDQVLLDNQQQSGEIPVDENGNPLIESGGTSTTISGNNGIDSTGVQEGGESSGQVLQGNEVSDRYYGQFTAQFYCTCENCFDESQWRNVKTGDSYILADPEYLPTGIKVTLSEGSVSVFEVCDGGESVQGRNITVFNSNHEEWNGDTILYPKVTGVGG